MPCGGGRPNGPPGRAGRCCSWSTGWTRTSGRAGLPSVASLLPTLVEGRAHVLVASRPHPELPVDVLEGHPLTSESIRVDLTPFEGAERLADRARQEIYSLTHGADADTAVDVLGLLDGGRRPAVGRGSGLSVQ